LGASGSVKPVLVEQADKRLRLALFLFSLMVFSTVNRCLIIRFGGARYGFTAHW